MKYYISVCLSLLFIHALCLTPSAVATTGSNNTLAVSASTGYVEVPNSASLNITGPLTIEAWIKTNAAGVEQSIVERYAWLTTDDGGYGVRISGNGKLVFFVTRNMNQFAYVLGDTYITSGQWHHVAGVFDGTELRIYLDGRLDGAAYSTLAPAAGTGNLKIGAKGDDSANKFNGLIDDVSVSTGASYITEFTPSRRILNEAPSTTGERSMKGWWNFDSGSISDVSGYSNHGIMIGQTSYVNDANSYQTSAAAGTQKFIGFDDLPGNAYIQPTRYPETYLSTSGNNGNYTGQYSFSSTPNFVTRKTPLGFYNDQLDFYIDFNAPVDNLSLVVMNFNIPVAAKMEVWVNYQRRSIENVYGCGELKCDRELVFNVNDITSIYFYDIVDNGGLNFDSFRFVYPDAATPTPTPTPTPAPTPEIRSVDFAKIDSTLDMNPKAGSGYRRQILEV